MGTLKLLSKTSRSHTRSLFLSMHSKFSSSSPVPTHDHIARLILEQKSPSQALQTFRWASKLPNYAHSQSTYRALIHKLCSFHLFDTVQELLDEMPHSLGSPPDEDVFVTIIRGLGRARMIRQVIKVADLVLKFDVRPSLKVYNSILDVLVKEDIDIARKFYREKMMDRGIQGDEYTYGILMKGLCLTNRIGEGFKLLQAIKSRNVVPNTVMYNTLLHALCKNGKVGRARSLMNEMTEPNDVTFNTLISAYCREENLIQALVMLEKSFNLGFFPDIIAVTKLLELLCNKGRVSDGVEVLERVESKGGAVDVIAYNTLIRGFCKIGKARVGYRLLQEMEHKGCLANVDTYNVLISGFVEAGNLDTALDLSNDMKLDGINWNFNTFDALLKGLCSGGRMEDGFRVLELMEESKGGARGRISPYNSILYGLYKENRLDEALGFLTKMGNLFPRAVDRSLRILGFCEEGSIQDAHRIYNQMVEEGGFPSAIVYDCLIRAFCREGSAKAAFELLNEMMSQSYFPVILTFNLLISEFCRQGKSVAAMKLLEDITERSCLPDSESYRPLVETLCQKRDFQMAESLILQMVEKDILPDHRTWNSMLVYLSQEAAWLEGKNINTVNRYLHCLTETYYRHNEIDL